MLGHFINIKSFHEIFLLQDAIANFEDEEEMISVSLQPEKLNKKREWINTIQVFNLFYVRSIR